MADSKFQQAKETMTSRFVLNEHLRQKTMFLPNVCFYTQLPRDNEPPETIQNNYSAE